MSVVTRVYKTVTTHYAVNTWKGKQVAERIGPNKTKAEARDAQMKREIQAGTYKPPSSRAKQTVRGFGTAFFENRVNANAEAELSRFRRFILTRDALADLHLDDWKPSHTEQLLGELRALRNPDGSRRLVDKSIGNFFNELSLMFDAAIRHEKCQTNPIVLAPNELKRTRQEEPEIYEVGEIAVLLRHHSIPLPVRVLSALCCYTGMREGEACGRRWRDLDDRCRPLGAISVHDQYNGLPLKTERPRMVPLHPDLASILIDWAQEGFELYTGRIPTPEDFIVPSVSSRSKEPNWTRSMFYKAFVKHAAAAGVRPRSVHSTRHSFITHAQRGGADKRVLERATHNAAGEMIDRYTHGVWKPVCDAVLCFSLEALPENHSGPSNAGNSGGNGPSFLPRNSAKRLESDEDKQGSIPRASTSKQHKNSRSRKPLQAPLQANLREAIKEANRGRKLRLASFAEVDPVGAAPGLVVCRALDAVLDKDAAKLERELTAGAIALGAARPSAKTHAGSASRKRVAR